MHAGECAASPPSPLPLEHAQLSDLVPGHDEGLGVQVQWQLSDRQQQQAPSALLDLSPPVPDCASSLTFPSCERKGTRSSAPAPASPSPRLLLPGSAHGCCVGFMGEASLPLGRLILSAMLVTSWDSGSV